MSDLESMFKAAALLGEVTGEDLLNGPNYRTNDSATMFIWAPNHSDYFRVPDDIALTILRDRVWESMRKVSRQTWWIATNDDQPTDAVAVEIDSFVFRYQDLVTAATAIHTRWKETHNVKA